MIDAALPVVNAPADMPEAADIAASGEAHTGQQATDIKEEKFSSTLVSHLHKVTGETDGTGAQALTVPLELLPDGKALPSLPLDALPDGSGLSPLSAVDSAADVQADSDAIIAGVPMLLMLQSRQERPAGINPADVLKPSQQETRPRPPVADAGNTDLLMATAADKTIARTDFTVDVAKLNLAAAPATDQPREITAPNGAAHTLKPAPVAPSQVAPASARLSIDIPVQQSRWADNLAGRVTWMAMNNQHSAQISLHPAELGPIEIRISLHHDQASVNFYAHNNTVRDAIESAFPKLRDMLHENGLNLSQSSVSDQSLSQGQGHSDGAWPEQSPYPVMPESEPVNSAVAPNVSITLGLIDHFV